MLELQRKIEIRNFILQTCMKLSDNWANPYFLTDGMTNEPSILQHKHNTADIYLCNLISFSIDTVTD